MEKTYNKAIHHVSILILKKQFRRALSILNFVSEQGIKNCEIVVMQSYCIRHIRGINAAINYLEQSQNKGPLIQMSLAQYYKQLNQTTKCFGNLTKIQKVNHQENKKNVLQQIIKSMQISLEAEKKPPIYITKYGEIDIEGINLINQIIDKYKKKEEKLEITYQSLKELKQERKLEGRLLEIVEKFIAYLEYQIGEKST